MLAYGDIRMVEEGEPCPHCQAKLKLARGIEVGQVFKLGTKYSEALQAKYNDEEGKEQLMVMGCYGIGVSRTMAAAVEQNYDGDGIVWPVTIAPFHVVVIPVTVKDDLLWKKSLEIYQMLQDNGIEVVLDDRDERAGVKFKDADLIGYPLRITVGKKYREEGKIELKLRREKEVRLVSIEMLTQEIKEILAE